MWNPKAPDAGFTLIEVLIALAIVAIALSAVVRAVGLSAVLAGRLRDRQSALAVACDTLTLDRTDENTRKRPGDIRELGGVRWIWTQSFSAGPVEGLRRVDITVKREGDPAASAELTGFVRTGA